MHLPLLVFITLHSANIIGPTRVSRQVKDFSNTFNNFLQSGFKPVDPAYYQAEPNKVNIVYKPVEEPFRIEKIVRVPFVKHVPQPVPVYVPQPYPVEKKVFVPYKVYEKQPVPIIHRYPVEKVIRVPVHIPVEQPIGILVPYPVSIGKRVQIPTYSSQFPPELREVPLTLKDLPNHDKVKYPVDNAILKTDKSSSVQEDENSVSSSALSPVPYTAEKVIPYGARLSLPNKMKFVEKQENHFAKEPSQNSVQVQINSPAPVVEKIEDDNEESVLAQKSSEDVELKNGIKIVEDEESKDESKEETRNIIFPTERNDIDDKS